MSNDTEQTNLSTKISDALIAVPKGLMPGCIKAIDRLVGAAIDIPVAYLNQKKAKINAQTESYKRVEASISKGAALVARADPDIVQRSLDVLVRKEYRKQTNREAVADAMIEGLSRNAPNEMEDAPSLLTADLDEDWLNVFERYAEDASSDRLQGLWGRVLAGEIRKPGRFSTRTLRFLSEFSQADALDFETFAKYAFGDISPKSLASPSDSKDIRPLVNLESSGLIQGASGLGLETTLRFNELGLAYMREDCLVIVLKGNPNTEISQSVIVLTPLGRELLSLLTNRSARYSAKAVALALRNPQTHACHLCFLKNGQLSGSMNIIETFWNNDNLTAEPIVSEA
jgi:Protein of unknown function (DUF2806)